MNQLFPAKKTQVSLKTCDMEFNITHNWRDVLYYLIDVAIRKCHLHLAHWQKSNFDRRLYWWGCGDKGLLLHHWWKWKLEQSL